MHDTRETSPGTTCMNRTRFLGLSIILALGTGGLTSQAGPAVWDTMSDTWAATDARGRILPMHEETGPLKPDKTTCLFYYIWHGSHLHGSTEAPFDISRILAHPPGQRPWGPMNHFHHWGESLFGYYRADDAWIIRKHAQLISDAGVDAILIDVTNGYTYEKTYLKLCETYTAIRAEGGRTPRIAFLTHARSDRVARDLYETLYRPGRYRDLWFTWQGKPLLLAKPADLSEDLQAFFTLRESWAWSDPRGWFGNGRDKWPWLDTSPQRFGWSDDPQVPEYVSVATAEHPNSNRGKSFHGGRQPAASRSEEGLYFREQWERALEIDPRVIMVTQWNEWIAQRFSPSKLGGDSYTGRPKDEFESIFIDAYTPEYNRDIEPMKGGYGDNYYYQMIAGVRRFKGARPVPPPSPPVTIPWDGSFRHWKAVAPEYRDDRGDVVHRDHPGYGSAGPYRDDSGCNDLLVAKVARDATHLFFYVRTDRALTPPAGSSWMNLLVHLEALGDASPNRHGYHFVLRVDPDDTARYRIHRLPASNRTRDHGVAELQWSGNEMALKVPRAALELPPGTDNSNLRFKWSDNGSSIDPTDWMLHGDVAPNARFQYVYRSGE